MRSPKTKARALTPYREKVVRRRAEVLRLRLEGWAWTDIARRLNIPWHSVRADLQLSDPKIKEMLRSVPCRASDTPYLKELARRRNEALKLYRQGETLVQIAEEFRKRGYGRGERAIREMLKWVRETMSPETWAEIKEEGAKRREETLSKIRKEAGKKRSRTMIARRITRKKPELPAVAGEPPKPRMVYASRTLRVEYDQFEWKER